MLVEAIKEVLLCAEWLSVMPPVKVVVPDTGGGKRGDSTVSVDEAC